MNRWGVEVGIIDDVTKGWNGTDKNGDPCTDGVYFYTYEGEADNGTKINGQGNVQIVGK